MEQKRLQYKMLGRGAILILIAVLAIGIISATRPSDTLIDLTAMQSILAARSLSNKVQHAIKSELSRAAAMAADPGVAAAAGKIRESGRAAAKAEIAAVQDRLSSSGDRTGRSVQRFALLDADGVLFAGAQTAAADASAREAFAMTRTTGKVGVGSPFQSKRTGDILVDVCAPIYVGRGKVAGAVSGEVNISAIIAQVNGGAAGESGYAFLADATGRIIADARNELGAALNLSTAQQLKGLGERMVSAKGGHEFYTYRGEQRNVGFAPVALTGWSIGLSRNTAELLASARSLGHLFTALGLLLLLIAMVLVPLHHRRLPVPVNRDFTSLRRGVEQVASVATRML